jgi:hypothetical protein
MKLAIIKDGLVRNTVNVPDDWVEGKPGLWPVPLGFQGVASEEASSGDTFDGTVFTKPPRPVVPPSLPSQRDLDRADAIAKAEAIATDATIPPRLKDFVAAVRKIL